MQRAARSHRSSQRWELLKLRYRLMRTRLFRRRGVAYFGLGPGRRLRLFGDPLAGADVCGKAIVGKIGAQGQARLYIASTINAEIRGIDYLVKVYDLPIGSDGPDGRDQPMIDLHASIAVGRSGGTCDVECVNTFHIAERQLFLCFTCRDEYSPLSRILKRRRRLPILDALSIIEHIAGGLARIHSEGIVHRNVSPESILVQWEGDELNAMLTDFSRAKFLTGEYAHLSAEPIGGHPGYLSPEQRAGDRRHGTPTDIYTIGRICYELIAGRRLPDELMDEQPLLSAFQDDLPSSFMTIARNCIAVAPELRPTARELFLATREAGLALWRRRPSPKRKRASGKLPRAWIHKDAPTPVDRT